MTNATMTTPAQDVLDHVKSEIDSIKVGADDDTVKYQPQAWNREGRVD